MTYRIFIIVSILLTIAVVARIYVLNNNKSDPNLNKLPSTELGEIIIYSKVGCSYCISAKALLDQKGIRYESIDLDNNPDLYNKLVNQTGQKTVPYIFINDEFMGGFTDLKDFLAKKYKNN